MATRAPASVPRRRGAPNAKDDALIGEILVEWPRVSMLDRQKALDEAVRRVVTPERAHQEGESARREGRRTASTEAGAIRQRVRRALRKMDSEERIRRALAARLPAGYKQLQAAAAYDQRLVAYGRAFDDIVPPDIPISWVARQFDTHRRQLIKALQRRPAQK